MVDNRLGNACYGNWKQDPKNNGASDPKTCNPINPATGNKYQIESDYVGSGSFPLHFQRTYNAGVHIHRNVVGINWSTTTNSGIGLYPSYALLYRPDGKILFFNRTNEIFTATGDIDDRLTTLTNGSGQPIGYRFVSSAAEKVETYDVTGKLTSISSRAGLTHTFSHDSEGRVSIITDAFGRQLTFTYDTANRIATMTDPLGGIFRYGYDPHNQLASVTYPGGAKRTYHYNEPAHIGGTLYVSALTGITDENGARYATYKYDWNGKAISTEHAGGTDKATLSYSGRNSATIDTVVTDPLGTVRTFHFQNILGAIRSTGQSQPGGAGCGPASSAMTYDANGNVASRTDFNGNKTIYGYDLARNLETSRTEGHGTPQARTITTQWHPAYRLPVQIAEPLRRTQFAYDSAGNMLGKTVQATNDATGAEGFGAATSGAARRWTYTYNNVGQVLTAKGPRTDANDVTTYAYDTQGNLATVTNALGHVTTLSNHDAHGYPGRITDANGITTDMTYHPRGWLTSRTLSGAGITETTTYAYDGVGQLTQVNLPDASSINYTYDPAHRLTAIADSLGNRIGYTLDAMGNRTREQVIDPNGQLTRQITRVYDALNRLQQITGGTQ
ncbi:MAG: DUF6531 domain-containing protein [Pseudomonadota bacterium]